ncbi:transcription termination factor MTERF15, mitochondrial-like [Zingiber officinale]|uniref:Mitochondrial transcription termination factor family protein n=1 Tax=Zingiber officinale TaxID=94328 RepID=A0A8J5FH84_ZINOF|nr:transcription termination factor MTERF15, mitochondrial-like [Zingiber officinale]XP_042422785.1 transcription termination factor MTERF15, mitochondrial-like [Zingiber officinale]KAG6488184.1 hypothetical protein ZIOFF_056943 [Zingiber officinale]
MLRSLVRRHVLAPSTHLRRVFFSTGTSVSSSGVTASPDPHFMAEYLVKTCGFSAGDASKVSKLLLRFQSTEKPDAVIGFFRSQGFDGANLRRIIAWRPGMLGWDVETQVAPKFKLLRDMGLSESDIIGIVRLHPIVIGFNSENALLARFKVWESLLGSKEILLKNLRRCGWFFSSNIENVVRPNINFLRDECGIPEERISLVLKRHPAFFTQKPDSLRALVDRVEGIGITRGSGMFLWILDVLHGVSREKFEAQAKIMNSFGWSNSDFVSVVKVHPTFLWLSTEVLQRKMDFLVKDVGMTPLDIAKHAVVLRLSLEKRLIPRFHVMEILKSEGLWTSQMKLSMFFSSPGPKFLQKYVLPYKDKLPKLLEVL